MIKPLTFETPIEDFTVAGLMALFIEKIEADHRPKVERDQEIEKIYSALLEFETNDDHGFQHSQLVFLRCVEIICDCPNIMRLTTMSGLSPQQVMALMAWASILHDFGRFLGYDLAGHQKFGAQTAEQLFAGLPTAELLSEMLIHHDYLCPLVDGQPLPFAFINNPLAEIFRLADKTSLVPAEEINRYYLTGKRLGGIFFDPTIDFKDRINFKIGFHKKEFLTFFLVLFSIQPTDFFLSETSELYRQWARDKKSAAFKLLELAAKEGLTTSQIIDFKTVISRFHQEILMVANPFD